MLNRKILSIVLLLSFALALNSCSLFDKTKKLESLVSIGKYDDAIEYYRENRDEINKEDAVNEFEMALDSMYKDYISGKTDSRGVRDYLDDLEKVQSDTLNSYGETIWDDVNKVEASREAYSKAEAALGNENYIEAISFYEQVIKDDINFVDANNKINECRESYKKLKIGEAENYAGKEDYQNAIKLLKDAVAVFGESNDVNSLMDTYQTKYDEYIYNNGASLEKDGNYDEAIKLLSDSINYVSDKDKSNKLIEDYKDIAVQELLSKDNVSGLITDKKYEEALKVIEAIKNKYPDSGLLKKTIEDTAQKFINNELDIIEEFIKKSDYESAFNECEKALQIQPSSSDLNEKKQYVEERLPVSLMKFYNSNTADNWDNTFNFLSQTEKMNDLFGNDYGGSDGFYLFIGSAATIASDYYLNNQFNRLRTFAVVCHHQLGESQSFKLNIYGDDKLISEYTITNKTAPEDVIDIDVSGVKWLRIEIVDFGGGALQTRYIGVVNPTLYYK